MTKGVLARRGSMEQLKVRGLQQCHLLPYFMVVLVVSDFW